MKKQFFFLVFLLVSSFTFGQNMELTLSVNKDTVLMNNVLVVKYTIKQADPNQFEPPKFTHFQVVSGPNTSTSVSYVNGDVSRESTYSFYLKPDSPGTWTIPAITVETADGVLTCEAKDIVVLPNPDGIQEETTPENNGFDNFFFNTPPRSFDKPNQPAKKKRKTYRL
ncbi:MAG TPA: hypothetical protein ENK85_03065 [Saprospiraceae bacterium]|nr:hypothetical protein [Saprospiraceae bacterium]